MYLIQITLQISTLVLIIGINLYMEVVADKKIHLIFNIIKQQMSELFKLKLASFFIVESYYAPTIITK